MRGIHRMESLRLLYHGSQRIIKSPTPGAGNPQNDYGLGFYCTESFELAGEWACTEESNGYANAYDIDAQGLSVMYLLSETYNILHWLSVLLENRIFKLSNDIAAEGRDYLLTHFLPDYRNYDIIIGYRADDSYFSFANAFLNNTLSLRQLETAMYLGKLGEQVVLKSADAFGKLSFREAIPVEKELYYPKKTARDKEARTSYRRERDRGRASDDIYLIDILREGWDTNDTRLRRNVSE